MNVVFCSLSFLFLLFAASSIGVFSIGEGLELVSLLLVSGDIIGKALKTLILIVHSHLAVRQRSEEVSQCQGSTLLILHPHFGQHLLTGLQDGTSGVASRDVSQGAQREV